MSEIETINSVKDFRKFILEKFKEDLSEKEFSEASASTLELAQEHIKMECIRFLFEVAAALKASQYANQMSFCYQISNREMLVDLLTNAPRMENGGDGQLIPVNAIRNHCKINGLPEFLPDFIKITESPLDSVVH